MSSLRPVRMALRPASVLMRRAVSAAAAEASAGASGAAHGRAPQDSHLELRVVHDVRRAEGEGVLELAAIPGQAQPSRFHIVKHGADLLFKLEHRHLLTSLFLQVDVELLLCEPALLVHHRALQMHPADRHLLARREHLVDQLITRHVDAGLDVAGPPLDAAGAPGA
jgi:hypothetical protein